MAVQHMSLYGPPRSIWRISSRHVRNCDSCEAPCAHAWKLAGLPPAAAQRASRRACSTWIGGHG